MYPVGTGSPTGLLFERGDHVVEFTTRSGSTYEMPELDASMYAKQQAVDEATDMEKRFAAAWSFISAALPEECVAEELGCSDRRKAGVPRVMVLYGRVRDAYWRDYDEAQAESMREHIESIGELPSVVDALSKARQLMSSQGGRQVFRATK